MVIEIESFVAIAVLSEVPDEKAIFNVQLLAALVV